MLLLKTVDNELFNLSNFNKIKTSSDNNILTIDIYINVDNIKYSLSINADNNVHNTIINELYNQIAICIKTNSILDLKKLLENIDMYGI